MSKDETVSLDVNLGAKLKSDARRAAKSSGVSLNEFVCNALESRVRREQDYEGRETMVRHGGKHLHGKHTGYEVTADGKYYPAPLWVQRFEELFAERQAIQVLVNGVIAVAQERLMAVEKNVIKAKAELIDDLGLDPALDWAYYGGGAHYLTEFQKNKDDEAVD